MTSSPLLEARQVSKRFPLPSGGGEFRVLEKIDLALNEGQIVALLGRSGCGKSTLLRILVGLFPASEGEVRYRGRPVSGPWPLSTGSQAGHDHAPPGAYYSGGMLLLMPLAEASLALRYVHLKHPDFIVLFEDDGSTVAYLKQWLDEGIPDGAATLIYRAGNASHRGVAIYEWRG